MNLPAAAPVAPASAADNAGPVIRDSNSSLARRLMLRNLQQYRHVVTEQVSANETEMVRLLDHGS